MKLVTKLGIVTLSVIVPVAGVFNPTVAQAKTTYHRTKEVKVSAKPYYSLNKKAKTYAFKGGAKHLVLKSNHALKNYKTTTWTRTKKTYVTKHGKKYLYYYVTNSKNNAKGWVWHKYLKAGKNYQSSKVTSYKGTFQQKKAGKFYKIAGSKSYIKFSHGVKLTTNTKYSATKKRTVYKHGKSHKYYYVTNNTTHQKGWVWAGYVKKAAKAKKATPTKVTVAPTKKPSQPAKVTPTKTTPTKKLSQPTKPAKVTPAKPTTKPTQPTTEAYNADAVRKDTLMLLNQERAKVGSAPLVMDETLQKIGDIRAKQLVTNFSHTDANGDYYTTGLAKKFGIWDSYYAGEDCGDTFGVHDTNLKTAQEIIDNMKATTDGHWDDLMNNDFTKFGVGLHLNTGENEDTQEVALQLGF